MNWLLTSAAVLFLGLLFPDSLVQASNPKTLTVPGLPGAGVTLADALGRADIMVVGQIVTIKSEESDPKVDRYRIKIKVTQVVVEPGYAHITGFEPALIEGDVVLPNAALLGNLISGNDILPTIQKKIPDDGKNYFFFISTDKTTKSNLIFKMLPSEMVMPSAVPEFPERHETPADILANQNIVIGRFMKMRPRFERSCIKGSKIEWWQEHKAVINVEKTVRGAVTPGLIEGDFAYSGSNDLNAGIGPRPGLPELDKDYLIFLFYVQPSENVQEDLIHGNDLAKSYIFYLSDRQPAQTSCRIVKILPADELMQTKMPTAAPTSSLPLPGNALGLDAATFQAQTIVVGHVVELTAFFTNDPTLNQAIGIKILKTVRGKAHGTVQYTVPISIGKEAIPEVGKDYLFFLSHYDKVLKIAPAAALSDLRGANHTP